MDPIKCNLLQASMPFISRRSRLADIDFLSTLGIHLSYRRVFSPNISFGTEESTDAFALNQLAMMTCDKL